MKPPDERAPIRDPAQADEHAISHSIGDKLDQLKFYRQEIQHEFSLLSNRVSSYLTSQSFLIIALASSMGNLNPQWGHLFRLVFPLILVAIGLVTSLQAWQGVEAAGLTIDLWHEKIAELLRDEPRLQAYRIERPTRSLRGREVDIVHHRSLWFATWTPLTFALAWCAFGALAIRLYEMG